MTRRGAIVLVLLAAMHAAVLLAGFLVPYHFAEQHRDYPFSPPMRPHFFDRAGRFHFRPFVTDPRDPARAYPIRLWIPAPRGTEGLISFPRRLFGVAPPGVIFLLGTDDFGRDILSRLLYGAQISLFTGLLAAFLSLSLGLVFGTLAGYYGRWPDQLLMRTGELMLALPWLYLLLGLRAFLPLHITPLQAFLLLIVVIGGVGWVRPARMVRSVVLSGKEREFVTAARGFGASGAYLMRRHILPLTYGVLLTQATVLIPQFILAEVSLSFLGLGVGEPIPSWGNMLAAGMRYHALVSHPWLLIPGLAMIPVLLAYLVLTDAILEPGAGILSVRRG
jgi:peptide/nickel transport system permease protein